jgi:hypothetical protein
MTQTSGNGRIYTVVDVMAGVAVGAYAYRRLEDARTCADRLRAGRDLQEDDVQLFEGVLNAHPDENQVAEIDLR